MKVVDDIKSELNKISDMDKSQKWDYYKSYYLKSSIVILLVLLMLISFIKEVVFKKDPVCMGCAYGVELTDEQKYALTDGYLEYFNLNPKKCSAVVATDNMFEGTAQQMDANSHEMALFAQIAAGEIYYLILDKDTLKSMENGGIYASLSEVLDEETVKSLKGMTIEVNDYESSEPVETAIDLKKLGFLTEDWQEGYLVFTIARPDEDYPKRFLSYLETRTL